MVWQAKIIRVRQDYLDTLKNYIREIWNVNKIIVTESVIKI